MVFLVVMLFAIATFQNMAGFKSSNPIILFVVMFFLNGLMLLVYVVMQIILVINTLDDRWPLGKISVSNRLTCVVLTI